MEMNTRNTLIVLMLVAFCACTITGAVVIVCRLIEAVR